MATRKRDRKAYNAAYRAANLDKFKATAAAYYRVNSDKIKANSAAWIKANPERVRARKSAAAWNKANPERVKAYSAAWNKANPERRKANSTAYRTANPDKMKAIMHRRRARKVGNGGSYTAPQWRAKLALDGHKCFYCGVGGNLTIDHDIPIDRGGKNVIGNILPACRSCNSSKGTKTAAEFLAQRMKLAA